MRQAHSGQRPASTAAVRIGLLSAGVIVAGLLAACEPEARGFALPPGDAERGRATFVALQCNSCHGIDGVVERLTTGADPVANVTLGGTVSRVKTYGDLVTSIINPSHRLSRGSNPDSSTVTAEGMSRMRDYNEVMTVQQLIDLTSFLQGTYEVWVPQYSPHYFP